MKHSLYFLILLLVVIACKRQDTNQPAATITGQFNPAAEGYIILNNGPLLDSTKIKPDGSFDFTLPMEVSESVMLIFSNKISQLYLEPGKTLELSINPAKFPEFEEFGGELGPINHYLQLADKLDRQTSIANEELFAKEVNTFIAFTDSVKKLKLQLLKEYTMKYTQLDSTFVLTHKTDIQYGWALQRLNYPGFFALLTGSFANLPDAYHPKYMAEVELNNSQLLVSITYQKFLEEYLDFKQSLYLDQNPKTSKLWFPESVARFRVILTEFTDTLVKDYVLLSSMNDHLDNFGTEHLETFLTNFEIHCQNEQYKALIQDKLERLKTLARGNPAPEFTAIDLNGETVSLSDYRGNLLYINLWASWSEWSLNEIPYWENLIAQFEPLGVKFISISMDLPKDQNLWKYLINENELSGIHLMQDPNSPVWQEKYFISDLPRYMLIDSEGNIIGVHAPRPSENMDQVLERLLN